MGVYDMGWGGWSGGRRNSPQILCLVFSYSLGKEERAKNRHGKILAEWDKKWWSRVGKRKREMRERKVTKTKWAFGSKERSTSVNGHTLFSGVISYSELLLPPKILTNWALFCSALGKYIKAIGSPSFLLLFFFILFFLFILYSVSLLIPIPVSISYPSPTLSCLLHYKQYSSEKHTCIAHLHISPEQHNKNMATLQARSLAFYAFILCFLASTVLAAPPTVDIDIPDVGGQGGGKSLFLLPLPNLRSDRCSFLDHSGVECGRKKTKIFRKRPCPRHSHDKKKIASWKEKPLIVLLGFSFATREDNISP